MKTDKKYAQNKKNTNWLPIVAAAVLVIALAAALISKNANRGESGVQSVAEGQVISAGESLVIPVSEVTDQARFYPVVVDGTEMEVIAVRDSQGNIRTAFNTCQVCYSSGRGYYVQSGDALVCQNCGSRFTVDQVEIGSGGCNPWPIFAENKTVTEDSIAISYDYLNQATEIFANWKTRT